MTRLFTRVALGGFLLASGGLLHASPIWTFSDLDPAQNASGGQLSNLSTIFNTYNDKFTWSYTVTDKNPRPSKPRHNGFWLVVNDGPTNPKGDENLAILYGDIRSGNIAAYAYDGKNNSGSWNGAPLLALFEDAITTTRVSGGKNHPPLVRDVTFTIDVSELNGRTADVGDPWEGVSFGEQLGIWFHTTSGKGSPFTFNADGSIRRFDVPASGWVDTGALATTNIPEPGVLYLSALGLIAFGASRRLSKGKVSAA